MDFTLLNMLFDAGMMVAIVALWLMWHQQGRQRKKVEAMLSQASIELQEATQLLEQVMAQRPELKQQQVVPNKQQPTKQHPMKQQEKQYQAKKHAEPSVKSKEINQRQHKKIAKRTSQTKRAGDNSQSAKIMRLKREGLSAEGISNQLDMPVAQVRLMLLLQTQQV